MAMSPVIGLLFLSSLWNIKKPAKGDLSYLWVVGYFLILMLGYFLSSNKDGALSELENNASFLLFPIIFAFSNLDFKSIFHKMMLYFVEGIILSIVIAIVFSTIKFFANADIHSFFYGEISPFHHTSYMAMYVSFGIAFLYYNGFHPKKSTLLSSYWNFTLITVFSIYVLLLLSKTGILITLSIHLFAIFYWIIKHKKIKYGILSLGLISTIIILSFTLSNSVRSRFSETFSALNTEESTESSTGIRLISWEVSWELFNEQPVLGTGTGDINQAMTAKFIEKGHNQLAFKNFNAHNQYLTTLTKSGIIGFLSLVLLLVIPSFRVKQQQHFIYVIFATIVALNFLTESVLQTQSGIVFIAFFTTFFIATLSKN